VTVALKKGQNPNVYLKRADEAGQSLAGTLVHRLFERHGTALAVGIADRIADPIADPIDDELIRLIRDEESADVDDLDALLAHAREAYLALCAEPALVSALNAGEALFEVPFSVRGSNAPAILRGTFDCLVRRTDGGITVLELKTGKPLPEHQEQLAAYLIAARALFPGATVDGTLVYARRDRPRH
jgi:RecB family exonuclease